MPVFVHIKAIGADFLFSCRDVANLVELFIVDSVKFRICIKNTMLFPILALLKSNFFRI